QNVFNPSFPVDSSWEGGPHLHGTAIYWRGPETDTAYVYHWSEEDYLKAYRYNVKVGKFDTSPAATGKVVSLEGLMPGGQLSLSANGNQRGTGVLWALIARSDQPDPTFAAYPARFLAFDAETLDVLFEDDTVSTLPKWMPPTVADGKVFVPTSSKEII